MRILTILALLCASIGPAAAQTENGGGHPYDPCAMVSKKDVASALGVATEQVFTPQRPTTNECVWAVGAYAGTPGQQVALSIQTIGEVKHARGIGVFSAVLSAVRQIPGAPITNANVNRVLDHAQAVVDLGDRAGWKSGTLTVVKRELLLQVKVDTVNDNEALRSAKTIAQTALKHLPVDDAPPGTRAP